MFMIQIIKQEIEIEESLKQRLEFICQLDLCLSQKMYLKC